MLETDTKRIVSQYEYPKHFPQEGHRYFNPIQKRQFSKQSTRFPTSDQQRLTMFGEVSYREEQDLKTQLDTLSKQIESVQGSLNGSIVEIMKTLLSVIKRLEDLEHISSNTVCSLKGKISTVEEIPRTEESKEKIANTEFKNDKVNNDALQKLSIEQKNTHELSSEESREESLEVSHEVSHEVLHEVQREVQSEMQHETELTTTRFYIPVRNNECINERNFQQRLVPQYNWRCEDEVGLPNSWKTLPSFFPCTINGVDTDDLLITNGVYDVLDTKTGTIDEVYSTLLQNKATPFDKILSKKGVSAIKAALLYLITKNMVCCDEHGVWSNVEKPT